MQDDPGDRNLFNKGIKSEFSTGLHEVAIQEHPESEFSSVRLVKNDGKVELEAFWLQIYRYIKDSVHTLEEILPSLYSCIRGKRGETVRYFCYRVILLYFGDREGSTTGSSEVKGI